MALVTVIDSFSMLPNKTLFMLLDLMSAFSSVDNSLLLEALFHLLVSVLARIAFAVWITPFQSLLQLFTWAPKHWFSLGSSLPTRFLGDLLLNVAWKKMKVLVALCIAMACRPPGFSVCGILQARTLEWVSIPSVRHCNISKYTYMSETLKFIPQTSPLLSRLTYPTAQWMFNPSTSPVYSNTYMETQIVWLNSFFSISTAPTPRLRWNLNYTLLSPFYILFLIFLIFYCTRS